MIAPSLGGAQRGCVGESVDLSEDGVEVLGREFDALAQAPDGAGFVDADIAALNIPTGIPLVYHLDDAMRPTIAGGHYLDPDAAREAAAAVANQGKK